MTKEKKATIRKYLAHHFPHQMVVSVETGMSRSLLKKGGRRCSP
jgi:hypothetical protein